MRQRLQEVFEGAEAPELAGGAASESTSPASEGGD
jgi:hypothetical protein